MENTQKPTFSELIRESEVPVLVDFYADWCAPCRMMPPILKEFTETNTGKVKVVKVDVDRNQMAAATYGVQSIPTLMMFYKGNVVWRQAGVVPASYLSQVLDDFMKSQTQGK